MPFRVWGPSDRMTSCVGCVARRISELSGRQRTPRSLASSLSQRTITKFRACLRYAETDTISVTFYLIETVSVCFDGTCSPHSLHSQGYYEGKQAAERALFEMYPEGGVALRPSFIYGTRVLGNGMQIPLGLVGSPLKSILSDSGLKGIAKTLAGIPAVGAPFVPPVAVESVAKAAVAAATDPSVTSGIMDVYKINADYAA